MTSPLARRMLRLEDALKLHTKTGSLQTVMYACYESPDEVVRAKYGETPPANLFHIVLVGMGCTCERCSLEGRARPAALQ